MHRAIAEAEAGDSDMAYDKEGYAGKWLSTEEGAHFFVRNGETAKQAILRFRVSQMVNGLPNIAQRILEYERRFGELATSELKDSLQQELPSGGVTVKKAEERPPFGSQEELDKLLGEEFVGYKGQAAVEKLLRERRGHVKGAFHRDDIGDIDLFWGDEAGNIGLGHILKRRNEQGMDEHEFIKDLAQVVEQGNLVKINNDGNYEYILGRKMVIIAPAYHGNKLNWVVTFYKTRIKKPPQ